MLLGYVLRNKCYRIRIFNPKFLHLVFLAGKKNKNKEAVTIAYCLLPIAYPHQKTFMPNGTLREQQVLLIFEGNTRDKSL